MRKSKHHGQQEPNLQISRIRKKARNELNQIRQDLDFQELEKAWELDSIFLNNTSPLLQNPADLSIDMEDDSSRKVKTDFAGEPPTSGQPEKSYAELIKHKSVGKSATVLINRINNRTQSLRDIKFQLRRTQEQIKPPWPLGAKLEKIMKDMDATEAGIRRIKQDIMKIPVNYKERKLTEAEAKQRLIEIENEELNKFLQESQKAKQGLNQIRQELRKTSELDSFLVNNRSLPLQNLPDHIMDIKDDGKEGGSTRKIWIFLVANVVIELLSAAFDQLASVRKPEYALAAILMALIGLVGVMTELAYRGRQERAGWRWDKEIPWFYRPTSTPGTYRRFGNFAEIVGLLCAILQNITATVAYVFYTQHSDNPIKLSFWPIVFAIGLLCSQFLKDRSPKVSVLDHAGHTA